MSEELNRLHRFVDGHRRARSYSDGASDPHNFQGDTHRSSSRPGQSPPNQHRDDMYSDSLSKPVTFLVVLLCVAMAFLELATQSGRAQILFEEWVGLTIDEFLYQFLFTSGNLEAERYWIPVSSSLVHVNLIHMIFNVWWFWDLGGRIERLAGKMEWMLLVPLLAIVASGWQYHVFEFLQEHAHAVGLSGVVYGCFGYMLVQRRQVAEYAEILTSGTISILLGWLVLCVILTKMRIWEVANTAHLTGLVFGALTGLVFSARWWIRFLAFPLVLFMLAVAVEPFLFTGEEIGEAVRQLGREVLK